MSIRFTHWRRFSCRNKGDENPKLLLTKTYKKRMLEAFQALMTKRRETHARDLESVRIGRQPVKLPLAGTGKAPPSPRTLPKLLPEDSSLVRLPVELPR